MRIAFIAAVAALTACATGGADAPEASAGPSPFPVERGTAPPPPGPAAGRVPPEGGGPAGLDFGRWRDADPVVYAPAFQEQVRARYADREAGYIRADLEANGFACESNARLDCRIEIMERQCAFDWYVVVERSGTPVAGFDRMCLGAR